MNLWLNTSQIGWRDKVANLRVGIVDIETSHPSAWIPILQEMGCEVHGIYDSGRRFSRQEVEAFARRHQVEQVYGHLGDLAEAVDVGVILSCSWDEHLPLARPFVERDKPVLVDKPIVGSVRDARTLLAWEKAGRVISGGSSLRFSSKLRGFTERIAAAGEKIFSAHVGCSGHPFYYGTHLTSLLVGLLGPEIVSVRHLSSDPWRAELRWQSGQTAVLEVYPRGEVPFFLTAASDVGVHHLAITDVEQLYRDYLGVLIPHLGEGKAPLPLKELLRADLSLIAALESQMQAGGWVSLDRLTAESPAWSGRAFAREYFSSQHK